MLNPLFCWRSSILMNSSLLIGCIILSFTGKGQKFSDRMKRVFYRGLTINMTFFLYVRRLSACPKSGNKLITNLHNRMLFLFFPNTDQNFHVLYQYKNRKNLCSLFLFSGKIKYQYTYNHFYNNPQAQGK